MGDEKKQSCHFREPNTLKAWDLMQRDQAPLTRNSFKVDTDRVDDKDGTLGNTASHFTESVKVTIKTYLTGHRQKCGQFLGSKRGHTSGKKCNNKTESVQWLELDHPGRPSYNSGPVGQHPHLRPPRH